MRKRVNIKMKKININEKGFTLIELLAVITIMGILMMVAIPAVTRIIENSRRDSFVNISKEYINTVRNAVLADNIKCILDPTHADNLTIVSAVPDGTYYFSIDTTLQETNDLMESGGKSPFGNAEMKGYIKWKKETGDRASGETVTKTNYSILMTDTGNHGIQTETSEKNLARSKVEMKTTATPPTQPPAETVEGVGTVTPKQCVLA